MVQCSVCGYNNVKFDPFMYLSLPLMDNEPEVGPAAEAGEAEGEGDGDRGEEGETGGESEGKVLPDIGRCLKAFTYVIRPSHITTQHKHHTPLTPSSRLSLLSHRRKEQLSGQEAWRCPTCKDFVEAEKKFDLWKVRRRMHTHIACQSTHASTMEYLLPSLSLP
jgi:rubredoxin